MARGRKLNFELDDQFRNAIERFTRANFRDKLQADDIQKLEARIYSKYVPDWVNGKRSGKMLDKRLGIKRLAEGGTYERGYEKGYYHDKVRGGLNQERFLRAIFGKRIVEDLENKTRLATGEAKGFEDVDLSDNIHRILRNNSAFYLSSDEAREKIIAYNNDPNPENEQKVQSLYTKWKNQVLETERKKMKY